MSFKIATLRTAINSLSYQYGCCDGSTIDETLRYPLASQVSEKVLALLDIMAVTPKRFSKDLEDAERVLTYAAAKVVRWALCKAAWPNLPEEDRDGKAWASICSTVPMVGVMSEDEKSKVCMAASKVYANGWEIFAKPQEAEELPPNCVPFRRKVA